MHHRWMKQTAIVGAVAFAVRLGYVLWTLSGAPSLEPTSTLAKSYLEEGYGLVAGYGYVEVDPGTEAAATLHRVVERAEVQGQRIDPAQVPPMPAEGSRPRMLHPPGLSLVVAGLHLLTGGAASRPLLVLGALLDTAAALLFMALMRLLFSARLGFVAGLAYALFLPVAWLTSSTLLAEGFLPFFVVATVWAILRGVRATGSPWGWYALAGLATGVGALLRPDYLLLPLWTAPALVFLGRRIRHAAAAMVLAQAIAVMCLLPWAARNHDLTGRWIFTSTSVGATLVGSLAEFDNPWHFEPEDGHRGRLAAEQGLASPWMSEADVYFRKLYLDSVREHPMGAVVALVKRLPLAFFAPYGFGYVNPAKTIKFAQLKAETGMDRYQVLLNRPGYVLAAYWDRLLISLVSTLSTLAAALMIWREKRRRAVVWFLLSPHLYSIAVHVVVHIEPRYLIPSVFSWVAALVWLVVTRARPESAWVTGDDEERSVLPVAVEAA